MFPFAGNEPRPAQLEVVMKGHPVLMGQVRLQLGRCCLYVLRDSHIPEAQS
jgi:hypothetical protein